MSREPSIKVIGIACATGGPAALAEIFGKLPGDFPCPIVVSGSIAGPFLGKFVAWLDTKCPIKVVAAEDLQRLEPGHAYITTSWEPLTIADGRIRLSDEEMIYGVKDLMFRSMAESCGAGAIGVALTGMGKDGAGGIRAIFDAGGHTIAQDRATSLVYAIPMFAVEAGGVRESLPVGEIGPRLVELVRRGEGPG